MTWERPRHPLVVGLSERQRLVLDGVAALAGFVSAGLDQRTPGLPMGLLGICLVLLASAPVVFRRRWPVPVLALVTAAVAALTTVGLAVLPLDAMLGFAAYSVAAGAPRRSSIRALAGAGAVLGAALGVLLVRAHTTGDTGIQNLLALAAAWFIGDGISARRAYTARLAEQRRISEVEHARQTIREERVRIARELHDVVAHSLTVITVQADLARRLMAKHQNRDGPAGGTRQEAAALETIETIGRAAQGELRIILGLLRGEDTGQAEMMPAPGLADLPELAETVRAAGTPVDLRISAAGRLISPALELSVYRIIQEALTNVVKHAPGAHATAELAVSASEISIEVIDDGDAGPARPPRPPSDQAATPGARHGIAGMRERAGAFGGCLAAEAIPGRGFRVSARIPLQDVR
jgi:signal transduction histidine kinase